MSCIVHHTHKIVKRDYFFDEPFLLENWLFFICFNNALESIKMSRCTQHAHKQAFASIITCISVSLF